MSGDGGDWMKPGDEEQLKKDLARKYEPYVRQYIPCPNCKDDKNIPRALEVLARLDEVDPIEMSDTECKHKLLSLYNSFNSIF